MTTAKEDIERRLKRKVTTKDITRLSNIGKKLIKEQGKGADGNTREELEGLLVHRILIISREKDKIQKRKKAIRIVEQGKKKRATKKPSILAARTLYNRSLDNREKYYTELNSKYVPDIGTNWEDAGPFMILTKAEQAKVKKLNKTVDENDSLLNELNKEQATDNLKTKTSYQEIIASLEL